MHISSYQFNYHHTSTIIPYFDTPPSFPNWLRSSYQGSRRCWWGRVHRQWWRLNCRAVACLTWLLPVDQEEENTELLPKPQEDGQNRLRKNEGFEQKDQANLPTQAKLGPSVCVTLSAYLILSPCNWPDLVKSQKPAHDTSAWILRNTCTFNNQATTPNLWRL